MNLKDISDRITKNIDNNSLNLCNDSTTNTDDMSEILTAICGVQSLELTEVAYSYEEIIDLKGKATLDEGVLIQVEVIYQNDSIEVQSIKCQVTVEMPKTWEMSLDEQKDYNLESVKKTFSKIIGQEDMDGQLTGMMPIQQIKFDATGTYDNDEKIWSVSCSDKDELTVKTLIDALNSIAKLDIPSSILPDIGIKKIIFHYEQKGDKLWDVLSVEVITDWNFAITDHLAIGSVCFLFEKRNSSYSFSLRGTISVATTDLPTYLELRDDEFEMGAYVDEHGCSLPSLSDIGTILGIDDKLSIIPEPVAKGKNLTLHKFSVATPYTLNQLNNFDIAISIDSHWNFFGIDGLALEQINIGFHREQLIDTSLTRFIIVGKISIADTLVQIGALYETDNGWIFKGGLCPDEKLRLDTLLVDFAKMLKIKGIDKLPIPEITLYDTEVSFATKGSVFHAEAKSLVKGTEETSIIGKLFDIKASININSALKDNNRTYDGNFKGELNIAKTLLTVEYDFDTASDNNNVSVNWKPVNEKDEITLVEILQFFGVSSIPKAVSDLNFSIKLVTMNYDISKGELDITVSSRIFETLSLVLCQKDYEIDVVVRDKITMSMLPIVGTYLHLLDSLAIEHLELYASSEDNPEKKTLKGAALLGSIKDYEFVLQVYHNKSQNVLMVDDGSSESMTKWFELNKNLGVFEFYRIGVGFIDGRIAFLLDAALATKPIELGLLGLGIGMNLQDPKDIAFYLSGVRIVFDNGALKIGGAFLKSTLDGQESYDGELLIKVGDLGIFAVGTYSGKSLFVAGIINKNIGGHPAFFITGVAASFGYNIGVAIPSIDQVSKFPLVSAALGNMDESQLLTRLKESLSIEEGQIFLAAGLKFTTYKLIDSFALLTFSLGNETEIDLLGLSQVSVPPKLVQGIDPLAFAQLALKASINLKEGFVSVRAQVTSESYILSKQCKLTGGFAFVIWFMGEHAGDFVVSLGGYHPDYKKPSHYPDVPRLGFRWDVTSDLKLRGDMYFALTPRALMAGGRLDAVFEKGPIKAWFIASADFLIAWKPFFYDARLQVGFGVAVKVDLWLVSKTIKVELSAGLHLWGPDFSGTAHISLYIVSFDIDFGAGSSKNPPPIEWSEFRTSFLPSEKESSSNDGLGDAEIVMPIALAISDGQHGEEEVNNIKMPILSSDGMTFSIKSAVPYMSLDVDGTEEPLKSDLPEIGVLPMGENKKLTSSLSITVTHDSESDLKWVCEPVYDNIPTAIWSMKKTDKNLIIGAATGLKLTPVERSTKLYPTKGYIDLEKMSVDFRIERDFYWFLKWQLPEHPQDRPIQVFEDTIMDVAVCVKRTEWIKELNTVGFSFDMDVDLSRMKTEADNIFTEEMKLGVLI